MALMINSNRAIGAICLDGYGNNPLATSVNGSIGFKLENAIAGAVYVNSSWYSGK